MQMMSLTVGLCFRYVAEEPRYLFKWCKHHCRLLEFNRTPSRGRCSVHCWPKEEREVFRTPANFVASCSCLVSLRCHLMAAAGTAVLSRIYRRSGLHLCLRKTLSVTGRNAEALYSGLNFRASRPHLSTITTLTTSTLVPGLIAL